MNQVFSDSTEVLICSTDLVNECGLTSTPPYGLTRFDAYLVLNCVLTDILLLSKNIVAGNVVCMDKSKFVAVLN
jgi:hypothetical protein